MYVGAVKLGLAFLAVSFVTPCLGQQDAPRPVVPASGALRAIFEHPPIDTLPTNDAASMALSPDGTRLAFVAPEAGRNRLFVQDLATGDARAFSSTYEVRWPFWSPDGTQIGFFNNDQVWRVDVESGETRVLVPSATWAAGGTWGPDGVILYGRHGAMSIRSVSVDGGVQGSATSYPREGQLAHFQPHFLPDGRHFLYYVEGAPEVKGIYVSDLDPAPAPAPRVSPVLPVPRALFAEPRDLRLVDADAGGVYAMGRLFFVKGGTLHAQPFDVASLTVHGTPQPIADDVAVGGRNGVALAASGDRVIYRTGNAGSTQQLTWFDRAGNRIGTVGEPFATGSGAMSISPDGTRVVVNRYVDQLGDIFVVDLANGAATRVTDYPANNSYPIWHYDSQTVVFSSNRTVGYEVYRQAPGQDMAPLVFGNAGWRHPMDWSRDGRFLVYRMNGPDLWVFNTATREEFNVVQTNQSARLHWPQITADGRWLAYQADDGSGDDRIYIHGPFEPPQLGTRSAPLSTGAGGWVRWRSDGRELYYVTPEGTIMAVALSFSPDGLSFTAAEPLPLFSAPMALGSLNSSIGQQYAPDAYGERFLVLVAEPAESPVHVLGY